MLRKFNRMNGGVKTLRGAIVFSLILQLMLPWNLRANPTGGNVVAGAANISGGAGTLTVNQASQRAIINWQDFSIQQGELTKFVQPNAASAALNRVVGSNLSGIYGTLQSNGQVYLINPNGIVIGPTGVINTGGFVASTLDVDNNQFMGGGDLTFKGNSTAKVVNLGKIGADSSDVILIAQQVENTGEIKAPNGTAALAAGNEVLVKASGAERLFVQAGKGRVANSGLIEAATAELKAAGGNEYALAINNQGTIRATQIENRGGRIFLTANSGNISHTGTLQATKTKAAEKIRSYEKADKGLVEIRTPDGVSLEGNIDTGFGVLFLDPESWTVTMGGPDTTSSGGFNTISNTYLSSLLSTNDVFLYTDVSHPTGGLQPLITGNTISGDISVEGAVSWNAATTLTLFAYNDIIITSAINASMGNLSLGAGARLSPESYNGSGGIFLNAAITVGGNFTLNNSGTVSQTAALVVGGITSINAGTGSITLNNANNDFTGIVGLSNTGSGAVLVRDKNDLNLGTIAVGGNLTLRANGSIIGHSSTVTSQGGKIILNSDRDASGAGNIQLVSSIINSNGGKIVLGGGNDPETTAAIGISAAGDAEKTGIYLISSTLQAGSGAIEMRGQGFAGTDFGDGIYSFNSMIGNSTTTGKITLIGVGGNGTNDNSGVTLDGSSITSQTGDISITGTSGLGSAQYNRGVVISGASVIESTGAASGAAKITIVGTATGSTYGGNGVGISDTGTLIKSQIGNISITGQGLGSDTNNHGVTVGGGAVVLSTGTGNNAASITIQGTGSATGVSSLGVFVQGPVSAVRSTAGAISITGTSSQASGIYVSDGGLIESIGTGANAAKITLTGTGGTSATAGRGIWLTGAGSGVASVDGDISLTGTGGAGSTTNYGMMMTNGSQVKTTGSAKVTFTATGGTGSPDFGATGTASKVGSTTATGNIVINANSVDWGAGLLKFDTSGTLTIQPRTAGTTIGVGGSSFAVAPGTLNVSSDELSVSTLTSRIARVIIGNNSSGLMTAYSFTLNNRLQLNSGSDITVAGIVATTKDIEFNFGQAGAGTFTVNSGVAVTANLPSVAIGGSSGDTFDIIGSYYGDLQGKGGADTFNIFDGSDRLGTIDGGAGNNTVDYSAITTSMTASVAKLLNINKLIGNASWLTLEGTSGDDLFEITGENKGQIGTIKFTDVSTLLGGEGADTFKFTTNGSKLTGNISGGNGVDVLDFSAITVRPIVQLSGDNAGSITDRVGSFDNIDQITGGTAGGRVLGTALADTFVFDGGNVTSHGIKFVGFDQVRGGDGNDTFNFNGGTFSGDVQGNGDDDTFVFDGGLLDGSLRGGGGHDLVDLSGAGPVTVTLNGTDGEGGFGDTSYQGVEVVRGSGVNVLVGTSAADLFVFTADGVTSYGTVFENFSEVQGLEGSDTFQFYSGTFAGSVYGGDDNDLFYFYGGRLTGSVNGEDGDDGFFFQPVTPPGNLSMYDGATFTINTGDGADGLVLFDFFATEGHSYVLSANSFKRVGGITINHDLDADDALILITGEFDDSVFTNFFAYTQSLSGGGQSTGDALVIPGVTPTFPDGTLSRPGFGDIIYTNFERDTLATPAPPVTPSNLNLYQRLFADFQTGMVSDEKNAFKTLMGFKGTGKGSMVFGSSNKGNKVKGSILQVSSGDVP